MRRLQYAFLAALFVLLIIGAAEPPVPVTPHAGTAADPWPVYNTAEVSVAFDDAYTTANIALARIDVDVLSESGAPVTTWTVTTGWTAADGMIKMPIRGQATTLANGMYQVRVRVWDVFGNASAWSTPVYAAKQWRTVPTPGGCRTLP